MKFILKFVFSMILVNVPVYGLLENVTENHIKVKVNYNWNAFDMLISPQLRSFNHYGIKFVWRLKYALSKALHMVFKSCNVEDFPADFFKR